MLLNPEIPRQWVVYKIINPEGRVYVGKTCQGKRRFKSHWNLNRQSNYLLAASILKYGKEAHSLEYIDQFDGTDEYADIKEIFWINKYQSNVNKYPEMNGFNQTDGGKSLKGYIHNEETKRKIGAANAILMKGNKLKPETIAKIVGKNSKPLLQYDKSGMFIKEFNSMAEAARELYGKSESSGHISAVAMGKRAHFRGFVYKYKIAN